MSWKDRDVFLVIWNGEFLELESADAIAFTEADARAIVAASPGRRESYSIDRRSLATMLALGEFAPFEERLRSHLEAARPAPFFVRDEAERRRRAR